MRQRALHRVLVGTAVAAAALAAWIGDPSQAPALDDQKEITAIELAQWIHDRAEGLRVVDLRPAADFAADHLPGAENRAAESLDTAAFADSDQLVLYGSEADAVDQAATILRDTGRRTLVLRGGYDAWLREVIEPEIPRGAGDREPYRRIAALSRYFGGRPRVGPAAAPSSVRGC